jgi:beta-glucanase (GH16 family)
LDEVDWEFMGGNNTHAETNYFGKGNTTLFNRAIYYPVETPLDTFHNYTVHWTKDVIEWYIDTNLVRTLHYADALDGYNFPQTPMNIRLGIWAGGDPSNNKGTIEWAGGAVCFYLHLSTVCQIFKNSLLNVKTD